MNRAPDRRRRGMAIFIALLLLGQGLLAAATPCPMMSDSPAMSSDMDHSMHEMADMMTQGESSDCCSEDGLCPMPSCLAVPALPGYETARLVFPATFYALWQPQFAPDGTRDSLYRPPILP